MATAPRQRIRLHGGNVPPQQPSLTDDKKGSRRKKTGLLLLWKLFAACLILFIFFHDAFRPHDVILPHDKPRPQQLKNEAANDPPLSHHEATNNEEKRPVLTAFLEPRDTLDNPNNVKPLPSRQTSADRLETVEYPWVQQCSRLFETFPMDDFPTKDPFLPWIHDVFPSQDGTSVQFVAQNRRRCDTGKNHIATMKFWEPQIALFQPVYVVAIPPTMNHRQETFRLASPHEKGAKETRFLCRFHAQQRADEAETTLSEYPFNYEYVTYRKGKYSMFMETGTDMSQFWLSQLMFSCPVPERFQSTIQQGTHVQNDLSQLFVDVIPIRTPVRNGEFLFTTEQIGKHEYESKATPIFDPLQEWGDSHVLPTIKDSGRWANIPVCLSPIKRSVETTQKQHRLTVCTWTAASYTRRGDTNSVGDTERRLREWITFHTLVGFDRIVVYDNTATEDSPLAKVVEEFGANVIYHRWPCQVCNNNRPMNANPGERSSQYAAEASCRERYGPSTDWMSFIDTDEYLVPMKGDTWEEVLTDMERKKMHILKMRSSRSKPIVDRMEPLADQSQCKVPESSRKVNVDPCVVPSKDRTFLSVYNCDFIRPPKPDRFERAMKQIYRPEHVQSHFVHYSTITNDMTRLRKDFGLGETYIKNTHLDRWQRASPEVFLDEINEGTLVHARSVLPHETMLRTSECYLKSKYNCNVGYPCPDSVEFTDALHKDNVFHDDSGKYCNCWKNSRLEERFIPKLEAALRAGQAKHAEK